MNSFVKFLLFLIIIIIGLSGLAFYWTIIKPQPKYTASLKVPGLKQEVRIEWDNFGVPHIFAKNEHDMYFAQGYVHAQDRLWQLTLSQMLIDGTFAKNLGEDAIEIDQYSLTMGFKRTAEQVLAETDAQQMQILSAFADGINAFTEANKSRLPIEFSLTGIKPSVWKPVHSIGISKIMGWQLNVSWWTKVMFGHLESVLPPTDLRELYPVWDSSAPNYLDAPETHRLYGNLIPVIEQERIIRSILQQNGSMVGSNAWVVDGSRSMSGYPLLAGDPHLGLSMPGFWYEVHLNLDERNISGASIPGTPGVILGQNDFAAWSFTSLMADNTDFFIIHVNPEDRGQYLADSLNGRPVYKPFVYQRSLIETKQGDKKLHEVRLTDFGPVINDIYSNKDLLGNDLIAMKWAGEYVSHEMRAIYGINNAASFSEFQEAIYHFGVVGINMMYADITGNIAMFTVGKLPVRDNPLQLRRSWQNADHWKGFIPQEQLPKVINPSTGYIANANNPVITPTYPYYISAFWEPDSRIKRIHELLKADEKHSEGGFIAIQNDILSVHARELTPVVMDALIRSGDTDFNLVINYFRNWDFIYNINATSASLFDVFFMNMVRNTFKDHISEPAFENFVRLESMPVRIMSHMLKNGSPWFKRFNENEDFARDSLIVVSMKQALDTLTTVFGAESSEWRWENLHQLTLQPPLFKEAAEDPDASGAIKMIVKNILSKGPFGVPGHGMTINNAQYDWLNPYNQVLGPSIRRIVDLSDMRRSLSVLPTGQSGNPLSRHFADQTDLWLSGDYRILEHHNNIQNRREFRTMTLQPSE